MKKNWINNLKCCMRNMIEATDKALRKGCENNCVMDAAERVHVMIYIYNRRERT